MHLNKELVASICTRLEEQVASGLAVLSESIELWGNPVHPSCASIMLIGKNPWGRRIHVRIGQVDFFDSDKLTESIACAAQRIHTRAEWARDFLRIAKEVFGLQRSWPYLGRTYKGDRPVCHFFLQRADYAHDLSGFPLEVAVFFEENCCTLQYLQWRKAPSRCLWDGDFYHYEVFRPEAVAKVASAILCNWDSFSKCRWLDRTRIHKLAQMD